MEASAEFLSKPGGVRKSRQALFLICFFSSLFGGTVSTLMSVYLPDVIKDLLHGAAGQNADNISATINAVFIFGWTAGGIVWGIFCDTLGRKQSFIYATLCYGLFTVLTASRHPGLLWWRAGLHQGFGIGGVLVITTMLISEGYQEKQREVLLGILSISIPIGIFSAGLLASLCFALAVCICRRRYSAYSFDIGISFFTESEKWRDAVKKENEALHNLNHIFSSENRKNLVMGSLVFGAALIGLWATFSWLPYWIQNLVSGTSGQKERGLAMMLMGGGGSAGRIYLGMGCACNRTEKNLADLFRLLFCSFVYFIQTHHHPFTVVYFQIAFITIFFGMSQGALSMYIPELFPTSLSATATGVCFNLGRIITGVAVFFIGSLGGSTRRLRNAIFYFSFVFLIGFVITLLNKHTKYSPKPDYGITYPLRKAFPASGVCLSSVLKQVTHYANSPRFYCEGHPLGFC